MSETTHQDLSGVAGTSLITLYIRTIASQRPEALIKDERAEALVRQLDQESLRKTSTLTADYTRVAMILKSREFDWFAQDFLRRHPDAVVLHIGCGLDTRFERVENGWVEWYDLDLPEVIELRRKLISGERERYHMLGCSVLEDAWMETVSAYLPRPFLFLAEGVFMYFEGARVKSLVLTLRDCFPSTELVFDAYSPFLSVTHNLRVTRTRIGVHLHWALKHSQDLEQWSVASSTGAGIRLLDERYPFQCSEPRMRNALQIRLVYPLLTKALGVFHYHL